MVKAINRCGEHDVLAAAAEDHDPVIALTRELISIHSWGGIETNEPVLDHLRQVKRNRTSTGKRCAWSGPLKGAAWSDCCL